MYMWAFKRIHWGKVPSLRTGQIFPSPLHNIDNSMTLPQHGSPYTKLLKQKKLLRFSVAVQEIKLGHIWKDSTSRSEQKVKVEPQRDDKALSYPYNGTFELVTHWLHQVLQMSSPARPLVITEQHVLWEHSETEQEIYWSKYIKRNKVCKTFK